MQEKEIIFLKVIPHKEIIHLKDIIPPMGIM